MGEDVYTYENTVTWKKEKIGELSWNGKPTIEVATPPEFKGHEGIITPEDMYVAAENVCIFTTFLSRSKLVNCNFKSFKSESKGFLEKSPNGYIFTKNPSKCLCNGRYKGRYSKSRRSYKTCKRKMLHWELN